MSPPEPDVDPADVVVPPAFTAIGYSGLFHTVSTMDMTPDEAAAWRAKAPCLLPRAPGWMLLHFLNDREAVLVRRDGGAVDDLFFAPRGHRV